MEGVVLFNGMAGRAGMISDKSLMGNATFFAICSMRNGDESAMINVQNSSSELNNNCGMRALSLCSVNTLLRNSNATKHSSAKGVIVLI